MAYKKSNAGRPPKYKSVAEMQDKIDKYFEDCKGKLATDENGNPALTKYGEEIWIDRRPPTVTGLALALGFTTRDALIYYQGKKEFVDTVTRAKSRCEQYAEERLYDRDGTSGAQFALRCNFGWTDKPTETETRKEEATPMDELSAALLEVAKGLKDEPESDKS